MSGRVGGMNGYGMGDGRHKTYLGHRGVASHLIRAGERRKRAKQRDKQIRKAEREKQRRIRERARAQQPPATHPLAAKVLHTLTGGWSDFRLAVVEEQPTALERAIAARTATAPAQDAPKRPRTRPAQPRTRRAATPAPDIETPPAHDVRQEVIEALMSLDIKASEARALVAAAHITPSTPLDEAVRMALAYHATR